MNNTYIYVGISGGIAVAVIIAVALLSSTTPESSLQQIINNKDCKGLANWEINNVYDDQINISTKLQGQAIVLSSECGVKAIKNMYGDSSSSSTSSSDDTTTPTQDNSNTVKQTTITSLEKKFDILQRVIDEKDCEKFQGIGADYTPEIRELMPEGLEDDMWDFNRNCNAIRWGLSPDN